MYILKINGDYYKHGIGITNYKKDADKMSFNEVKDLFNRLYFGVFRHELEVIEV